MTSSKTETKAKEELYIYEALGNGIPREVVTKNISFMLRNDWSFVAEVSPFNTRLDFEIYRKFFPLRFIGIGTSISRFISLHYARSQKLPVPKYVSWETILRKENGGK